MNTTKEEEIRLFFYFVKGAIERRNKAITAGVKRANANKVLLTVIYEKFLEIEQMKA